MCVSEIMLDFLLATKVQLRSELPSKPSDGCSNQQTHTVAATPGRKRGSITVYNLCVGVFPTNLYLGIMRAQVCNVARNSP